MNDAPLTDVDRRIFNSLLDQIDVLWNELANLRGPEYATRMREYGMLSKAVGQDAQWGTRLMSVPQDLHHALLAVRPDGIRYTKNTDFIRFLMNRFPQFKEANPLADKKWEDVSPGTSRKGGPLPQADRQRLARENELILDEHGKFVRPEPAK